MTLQESFTFLCRHLIAAPHPSMRHLEGSSPLCQYRGKGGTKCAVGWLIPDSMYVPGMEAKVVTRLVQLCPDLLDLPSFRPWNLELLELLQNVPDDAAISWDPEERSWGEHARLFLRDFADELGLVMEV